MGGGDSYLNNLNDAKEQGVINDDQAKELGASYLNKKLDHDFVDDFNPEDALKEHGHYGQSFYVKQTKADGSSLEVKTDGGTIEAQTTAGITDLLIQWGLSQIADAVDAVGYSIQLSVNGNIPFFTGSGIVGINFVIFTKGKYAGVPYKFLYYGGGVSVATQLTPSQLKNITDVISADASISVSPFVAMFGKADSKLDPESWTGWFIGKGASLKLKAGFGPSFGLSYFYGVLATESEAIALTDQEAEEHPGWQGATFDLGFGPGTPSIKYSSISTYQLFIVC